MEKFKVGDKVIIRYLKVGQSFESKHHNGSVISDMQELSGKETTISSIPYKGWYRISKCPFDFHKSWLKRNREAVDITQTEWKPKGGEWYIDGCGLVHAGLPNDTVNNDNGTKFSNNKDAIEASKIYRQYHRLYQLALELNEGWQPDWNKDGEDKHYIYYSYRSNKYCITSNNSFESIGAIYFKSRDTAQQAINYLS